MKIIHVSIYPPRGEKHAETGGVASYTKNLITQIPYDKKDEVFVLCNKIKGEEEYTEDGIKVIRCFDRNTKFLKQINKKVKEINPDVIHFQQELALYGGIITAYLLQWLFFLLRKYKVIVTLHGVVDFQKIDKKFVEENNSNLPPILVKIAFLIIYRPLCLRAKKIIVHEKTFRNILIKRYRIKKEKIDVIYHGVEDLTPAKREVSIKKIKVEKNLNIVLFMGYLTGYKGIDLLIEGYAEYSKKDPKSFLIIGSGKHPKLKNDPTYLNMYNSKVDKAKKLINKNKFKWVGFIDENEIESYYSASDVSVFPYTTSISSSGPMAISIGFEKPFLASSAFKGLFPDKILFNNDAKSFASKLEDFFNHRSEYQKIYSTMKKDRLWSNVGEKTYLIYKNN